MTTLAQLLFGDHAHPRSTLTDAIDRSGVGFGRLGVNGLSLPAGDIASAIAKLLDVPVGNLAIQGWRRHRDVEAACNRTRHAPEDREVVSLLEHKIKSRQSPVVEVVVNGVATPVLKLGVEVEIKVTTTTLVIERGEVTDVQPGPAVATARITASDTVLAERRLVDVDLSTRSPALTASRS